MALTTKLIVSLAAEYSSALDLQTAQAPVGYKKEYTWASGVGADQADKIWSDQRQIAASGNEALDLAGVLTDAFGVTATFVEVLAILIESLVPLGGNNILVGGAAANAFSTPFNDATDKLVIRPGGLALLVARDATGFAVTAGTGDQLKIENSAGGTVVDYKIIIVGRSA